MNNSTFLIESLQRTLNDLYKTNLSKQEQQTLIAIGNGESFRTLFDIPEEVYTQIGERELSELTGYQFNTVSVGMKMLDAAPGGISRLGHVCFDETTAPSNHFAPRQPRLVFRLVEQDEKETMWCNSTVITLRLRDTTDGVIYHVNFEVVQTAVIHELMDVISGMLPGHLTITIKK